MSSAFTSIAVFIVPPLAIFYAVFGAVLFNTTDEDLIEHHYIITPSFFRHKYHFNKYGAVIACTAYSIVFVPLQIAGIIHWLFTYENSDESNMANS